jgi:XTP/dITP diphosphohydrolase
MKKIEKIVVATKNPAKVEKYGRILSQYANQVVGLQDVGIVDRPEEIGETAEENAEIKGKYYAEKTGLPVFSEDEALYVDFLPEGKQPGVHVRRIDGKDEADDDRLLGHWEKIVAKVAEGERTGKWHIAYCIASPNGIVKTTSLEHPIVFFSPSSKVRISGWPMSSLEGPAAFNKPHSEMTDEEKREADERTNEVIAENLKELLKNIS